jgi:glutamate synthase domain-containing protein 2
MITNGRIRKKEELGREPFYVDVNVEKKLGGFYTTLPVVVAAMGSTSVANRRSLPMGEGAAKAGIILAIGENMLNVRGYDHRKHPKEPCLVERMLSYLENIERGEDGKVRGGLLVQANLEDRKAKVWETIYADDRFGEYFDENLIGFEIKCGQGAKPGMGGEIKVDKKSAQELKKMGYFISPDPDLVEADLYERHSAPGTFTWEGLEELIENTRKDFPEAPVWVKTGPYDDVYFCRKLWKAGLEWVIRKPLVKDQITVASKAGASAITIDGSEGGSGMSPRVVMDKMGLSTLDCLGKISDAKRGRKRYKKKYRGNLDMIIAGGLTAHGYGSSLGISLAVGADGIALGRAFLIAAEGRYGSKKNPKIVLENPADGIVNLIDSIKVETQYIISSLGKYSIEELGKEDVKTRKKDVANLLGIRYSYEKKKK